MVRFTLRQCMYFRAVAEHGGVAQAARALNISQPSVSQAIDKLENITGLMLFERHHARGMTLTMHGRLFLHHATALEQQTEQVAREAAALATEAAGEIRLGVFWTLSPFFAARLIRSFTEANPGVKIRQEEMSLFDLGDSLRKGVVDVTLTYDRGADSTGLDFVELVSLKPMVVVSANHPLADRDCIKLSDFANEPYVMLDGPGSRTYFEALLGEGGINPPISYVSTSLESVRSAVAAGFGFTLLVMRPPSSTTYDGGEIKTLQIDDNVRPLKIVLGFRDNIHRGVLLRRFADHATSFFKSIGFASS